MKFAYAHCAQCRFHTPLESSGFLLCTLPAECAPPPATAEAMDEFIDDMREMADRGGTYLGTDCDRMRRMGALCGPRGNLWTAREGEQA